MWAVWRCVMRDVSSWPWVLVAVLCAGVMPAWAQDPGEQKPTEAQPPPPPPPAEVSAPRPDAPPPPPPAARPEVRAAPVADVSALPLAIDPENPVVRAVEGNWGMFFRFGGLSTMAAIGESRDINGLLVTQVGLRRVFSDGWIVPFYAGTGVRLLAPDGGGDPVVDGGLDVGAGFEYHFREWRRISPFVGLSGGLGFSAGDDEDVVVGLGVGPTLGVEYYVADRVSLIAQYMLTLQLEIVPDEYTGFSFNTLSGGALTLVFYF